MKKKSLILTALVLALALTVSVSGVWAYFTTYAEARGGLTIHLGSHQDFHEEFSEWTKRLSVTNTEGYDDIYVRAKAFGPAQYPLEYEGENWTPGPESEGYYYYLLPVPVGESTSVLNVRITGIPEDVDDGESFNVVVIYESIPVPYDEDGNPIPPLEADWSQKLDSVREEGGVQP